MDDFDPEIPKRQRIFFYKKETFSCAKCSWQGLGAETKLGEVFEPWMEIICPKCREQVGNIIFASQEEILVYGTEVEKNRVRYQQRWRSAFESSLLKEPSELPDISDENMEFILKQIDEPDETRSLGKQGYILIVYKESIIWKEMRAYQYSERFVELAEILKKKYGSRMIDFIPADGVGIDLYGDELGSVDRVKKCRESLSTKTKGKMS